MADLRNASLGVTLSHQVEAASTPWQRSFGFLFRASIEPHRGLWFAHCRAIHTLAMRSAVDVLLLDDDGCIIALRANVRPNRPCITQRGTRTIVEMGPGFLGLAPVRIGDRLVLER